MNFRTILDLPRIVEPDDTSVLQRWVQSLPRRHQGVMLTAIRGCDGSPKEDDAKQLNRMIRRAVLNPYDIRETESVGGFFGFDPIKLTSSLADFLHSLDQYPLHYVMHITHACEVIAYCHPQIAYRVFFTEVYNSVCHMLHLYPESQEDMNSRLTTDRVALDTVERDFHVTS